ncbi:RDD family protein [Streptomyces sp. NPDC127063]|uniref:RDD family protein n=1 Tax=Streptomyces sp. NPDC127063 TaxID=3347123 RepID=UPI00365724CD
MSSAAPATAPPSAGRRLTAVFVDALLALAAGLAAAVAVGVRNGDGSAAPSPTPSVVAAALGAALAVSFANHVLLTWAARASLGKLAAGLRVVGERDGGRPGPVRLVGRWLWGFVWAVVAVPLHVATDSDVEQQDAVGVRVVRRRAAAQGTSPASAAPGEQSPGACSGSVPAP